MIGFSTYGEQYHAMHINQTFTGVAIGTGERRRCLDPAAPQEAAPAQIAELEAQIAKLQQDQPRADGPRRAEHEHAGQRLRHLPDRDRAGEPGPRAHRPRWRRR